MVFDPAILGRHCANSSANCYFVSGKVKTYSAFPVCG